MNSTDICNMALAYIGQGRIASLEEKGEEAVQCKLFYNHLRRKLLSEYRWNFAERYVKLALLDKKNTKMGLCLRLSRAMLGHQRTL